MSKLTVEDYAKLRACGISAELADQAQLYRVDSIDGAATVGRSGKGNYEGIVYPYFRPGHKGEITKRLRRDRPDVEMHGTERKWKDKYMSPPGGGNKLYFVPGTNPEWLVDPKMPIVITEGEKKCLALWGCAWHGLGDAAERPPFLPIGLSGVWNWKGTIGKTGGPNGERLDVKGPIPDLSLIAWADRGATILFDVNTVSNDSVHAARLHLSSELQRRNSRVSWWVWPEDTPEEVNGIDDLIGAWGHGKVLPLIVERARPCKIRAEHKTASRKFEKLDEDRYRMSVPTLGTSLDIDRVHWEHNTLTGMLHMRCELPGAKTFQGSTLSVAEFNISGPRGRQDRAKFLRERTSSGEYDWDGFMEEFCQQVLADQSREPEAQRLADIPRSREADRWMEVSGLKILAEHPTIFFGDGGAAKSYMALYVAGKIAAAGVNVALFDWELAGGEHADRYARLFGEEMPTNLWYMRLTHPLVKCQDGLRRFALDKQIGFAVFDSVGFACGATPESAESALDYFRAVRRVCPGSLHIAHRTKNGENTDRHPFGSIFWSNAARMTWYMEGAPEAPNSPVINVAMHNRKGNLGGRASAPIGFSLVFSAEQTVVRRSDPAENSELAAKVPVWQRMQCALKHGAISPEHLAEALNTPIRIIQMEISRRKSLFTMVAGKVGLVHG